ncbi:hypothetical protein OQ252_11950 [Acetobacter farinalis]|uniref:Fibronectin type-III domain-containing protein n=1 Tax=Acetobacter farinalis TaxID=1260984 RepID=A0ABT3Q9Y9_9PROT|nr:hypothetical protein [Acetobacter farinalis]MCX2562102.1 hypothetical protein [Acetobacter farinalis]NHO30726.1 hypothetical protein [Acetobacter farinalis]
MKWIFGKATLYPGSEAVKYRPEPKERPAIISDDGVTIAWTKTIPEAGLLTLVYRKNDIEGTFFMETKYIVNDGHAHVMGAGSPLRYYKVKLTDDGRYEYTRYIPSPEECQDVGKHLCEALPLWQNSAEGPFFYPPRGTMTVSC